MNGRTRNALLVGAGFLAGTLGVKALASPLAKKGYVQVVAQGMRAKNAYLDVAEQAKAEVDDIVAEASYLASTPAEDTAEKPAGAPATA